MPVSSEDDAYNLFFEALSNRAVAEHNLNRNSSRSHVIYTFYITTTRTVSVPVPLTSVSNSTTSRDSRDNRTSRSSSFSSSPLANKTNTKENENNINNNSSNVDVLRSKLHLVDLAGSERVEKTKSVGGIQKEANHINKSLSFLEHVVLALTQSKRDHIPYRSR